MHHGGGARHDLWAGPLALAQPSNDDISNATTFSTLPFSDGPIDTTSATTAADDPSCAGNGHSVWYAFTLSSDVTVEIDTFNSDYDTTLSAYTGSPGNLTQIACNDDAGDGVQSAIVFDAMGGTTYFIMAASFFDSPGGTLFLHADVPPPPLHIGLTVSSTGLVNPKTGVATVSGTITCNNDARYFIASELDQRIGRQILRGFFGIDDVCTAPSSGWSAQVTAENGLYVAGRAVVSAFARASDGFTEDFASVGPVTIALRAH